MHLPLNEVVQGDCLEVMQGWSDASVTAVVTDPPYGLSFMGKQWDHGLPGVPFWSEILRVAKPGAPLLAFGGTRTFHRLACAIEDAGWAIRDCLCWLYGSGFPKSLDVSKAIDKAAAAERTLGPKRVSADGTVAHDAAGKRHEGYERPWRSDPAAIDRNTRTSLPATPAAKLWDGWGTALKPAWEPIILAMKPLDGTFAENAQTHGVAGLNIDGGRIGAAEGDYVHPGNVGISREAWHKYNPGWQHANQSPPHAEGRWPANVILDERAAAMLDEQSGERPGMATQVDTKATPSRYFGLDKLPGLRYGRGDTGGASRFFYCAKASRSERTCKGKVDNDHPTVKPLALMRYLCKLVKMPEGTVILDPFAGSGSTCIAALKEGIDFIGIEQDEHSCEIARARLAEEMPLMEAM